MPDSVFQHELLTAINQILGYAELLAEEVETKRHEALLSDLDKIRQAACGLLDLVNVLFEDAPPEDRTVSPAILNEGKRDHSTHSLTGDLLVVDDCEANRDILSRMLSCQGHRIVMAENGVRALEWLREKTFDLVLLDVMMPGMNGFEVLERIKKDSELTNIPVIIISAISDMDSVIQCIEQGAEDYLTKPFNPTLLNARIGAALEKKRLREQEKQYLEQAIRVEAALERHRALTQAVAGMAHEINTPLGIACTGISIVENRLMRSTIRTQIDEHPNKDELFQDVLDATELIKKNIHRACQLIENFKKIAVNQILETREKVDLPDVVHDAVDLYKMTAKEANLEFEIDISGILGSRVWQGYPGYLGQILLNFFQNIDRYAYPGHVGGKVDIQVGDLTGSDGHSQFILTVRDYGAGISIEILDKIFDPFFTTGRGRGGTGLGLAIVKNLITMALKGTIEVASMPNLGTCFVMQFPKTLAD